MHNNSNNKNRLLKSNCNVKCKKLLKYFKTLVTEYRLSKICKIYDVLLIICAFNLFLMMIV